MQKDFRAMKEAGISIGRPMLMLILSALGLMLLNVIMVIFFSTSGRFSELAALTITLICLLHLVVFPAIYAWFGWRYLRTILGMGLFRVFRPNMEHSLTNWLRNSGGMDKLAQWSNSASGVVDGPADMPRIVRFIVRKAFGRMGVRDIVQESATAPDQAVFVAQKVTAAVDGRIQSILAPNWKRGLLWAVQAINLGLWLVVW